MTVDMSDIPLKVEIHKQGEIVLIDLAANFYTANTMAHNLKIELLKLFEDGYSYIIVNMNEVTSIDSEGLGTLSMGYKGCNNKGGYFALCELINRDVADVLEIVNLDKIIPIYKTKQEALIDLQKLID